MVALRTRRPTAPAPVEPVAAPVAEPVAAPAPQSDSPMLETLQVARDSIPDPNVSALQQQLAAVKQAEEQQRQAFEAQRQIAAQMQIEKAQPKQEVQLSERDLQFLGSRPGVQNDPGFAQTVGALAHVFEYGTDAFYDALEMKFPRTNYRREEPRQEDKPPPRIVEESKMEEELKPARRIVTSGPVSRSGTASGDYTPGPSSVKLSPTEREIAAGAGMTDKQYAEQKLRLMKAKQNGFYNE